MLFRTLKRVIDAGRTNGMSEMLDAFHRNGDLTEEEYSELKNMLLTA